MILGFFCRLIGETIHPTMEQAVLHLRMYSSDQLECDALSKKLSMTSGSDRSPVSAIRFRNYLQVGYWQAAKMCYECVDRSRSTPGHTIYRYRAKCRKVIRQLVIDRLGHWLIPHSTICQVLTFRDLDWAEPALYLEYAFREKQLEAIAQIASCLPLGCANKHRLHFFLKSALELKMPQIAERIMAELDQVDWIRTIPWDLLVQLPNWDVTAHVVLRCDSDRLMAIAAQKQRLGRRNAQVWEQIFTACWQGKGYRLTAKYRNRIGQLWELFPIPDLELRETWQCTTDSELYSLFFMYPIAMIPHLERWIDATVIVNIRGSRAICSPFPLEPPPLRVTHLQIGPNCHVYTNMLLRNRYPDEGRPEIVCDRVDWRRRNKQVLLTPLDPDDPGLISGYLSEIWVYQNCDECPFGGCGHYLKKQGRIPRLLRDHVAKISQTTIKSARSAKV